MRAKRRISARPASPARNACIINGLVGRLRMIDAIKKHPEILDEKVSVAAVITGLGRTGSTLFHRMLAVAPGFTAIRWWETQNFAQFPGEERGNPVERRRVAVAVMDGYVKAGLMSVHPFAIDEPDEEIIILDQVFVGTMPESAMYVPSYAKWLETYDHHQAYQDLKTILKYLQWQDPTRKGKRWVLKTPGHLGTIRDLLDTFPEAKVIMNHRDPVQTVPSYCSFVTTLSIAAELGQCRSGPRSANSPRNDGRGSSSALPRSGIRSARIASSTSATRIWWRRRSSRRACPRASRQRDDL